MEPHTQCATLIISSPNSFRFFLHNLSGYDAHLFVKDIATEKQPIDVIPQNKERYISFTKHINVDEVTEANDFSIMILFLFSLFYYFCFAHSLFFFYYHPFMGSFSQAHLSKYFSIGKKLETQFKVLCDFNSTSGVDVGEGKMSLNMEGWLVSEYEVEAGMRPMSFYSSRRVLGIMKGVIRTVREFEVDLVMQISGRNNDDIVEKVGNVIEHLGRRQLLYQFKKEKLKYFPLKYLIQYAIPYELEQVWHILPERLYARTCRILILL